MEEKRTTERRATDPWRAEMERKMDANTAALKATNDKLDAIRDKHETLNAAVRLNNSQTQHMFDIFSQIESFLRFLGRAYDGAVWLAKKIAALLKPLVWIAVFIGAVWAYFETGKWEMPL